MHFMRLLWIIALFPATTWCYAQEAPPKQGRASASAHGAHDQRPWGVAGKVSDARRTIEVRMSDAMRFSPEAIEVREGETIRFVVANDGMLMHELVIGTKHELEAHAGAMKGSAPMTHDERSMVHVSPGKRGDLVWTFNRPGRFDFACLVPGHYEAGMVGQISVDVR